ncbi:MAG: T9SS type A sorting domain-containing protein, partial [Bacteroidia bacterium]
GSNGWISFGSPLTSLFNGGIQLPDTSIHTNGIAYLGGAFFPGNSPFQHLKYDVIGTAPNRTGLLTMVHLFSFNNFNSTNYVQLKLFEATGEIEVHVHSANTGAPSTIGLVTNGGTTAITAPNRNGQAFTITTPEAWRFTPQASSSTPPPTVAWTLNGTNPAPSPFSTADTILVTPAQTSTYCVVVTDTVFGCADTACSTILVDPLTSCLDSLKGTLFQDVNNNGSFDAGDYTLGGFPVIIGPGQIRVFSDNNGRYALPVPHGTYSITAPTIPGLSISTPLGGSYTAVINSTSGNFMGDFAYDSTQTNYDLEMTLICGLPRRGFIHRVAPQFRNNGTVPISATVVLNYDPLTTISSASQGGVHDPVNHTVTWSVANIQPGRTYSRFVYIQVPLSVALSTPLTNSASIASTLPGEINQANNTDSCTVNARGAFDPNDKYVDQPAIIYGHEWLTYRIRFQNTGNDTAFNVWVDDNIDPHLDLNTFEMIGSSHEYTLMIDQNRKATWTFANILLPDSTTNEPLSHGTILYRIKPQAWLLPGDRMENTAAIFFDFNAPIITNTTLNTIASPLVFEEKEEDEASQIPDLEVFPNPAKDIVNITFENAEESLHRIVLFGMDGRIIRQTKTIKSSMNIEVGDLAAGMYMLRITDGAGRYSHVKLVIR